MAARHRAEQVLATPHLLPCRADRGPGDHLAPHRDDLLTEQDAEQADQRDHRRSGRPDVEQAVDDAGQQAGARPVTSLSVMLELQRDWAQKDTYDAVMDIVKTHYGAYGIGVEYVYTMVHKAPPTVFPQYVVPSAANHR